MWPQTLQMSEDDCRSVLRRLELESYASVIGVFRAQGGLSDRKSKILEELRSIFHISQERHRAEARRVSNDEYLATISKAVSGPNTWQEWSREGRRSYPMLPRVSPQTALGWIANNLAAEAANENAKLPFPASTAATALEEQTAIAAAQAAARGTAVDERLLNKYVVTSDPFKMPDIPAAGIKKQLKRGMNDSSHVTFGSSASKKRNIVDTALNKQKHVTATTTNTSPTSNSRKSYNNKVLQQRFFYQQQQKAKKLAKAANKREKTSPISKIGRKSKKFKLEQQQLQQQQEQQLLQQELDFAESTYEQIDSAVEYHPSTNAVNVLGHQQYINEMYGDQNESLKPDSQKPIYLPLTVPHIGAASSKRDITRNLTKLQIPAQVATTNSNSNRAVIQSDSIQQVGTSPILISKSVGDNKLAPLSTPVQKYIVEDRQPPTVCSAANAAISEAISPTQQQALLTQYPTSLPHIPASNKLRAVNTTLLPPGTKLTATTKKLGASAILTSSSSSPTAMVGDSNAQISAQQLYSLVDGSASQQSTPVPTHAPPAVIQLHGNDVLRTGVQQTTTGTSTMAQSKVLTTKILPIVLSGNLPTSASFAAKLDSVKNGGGSTIVSAPASNFVTNSAGTTIIKSLSSPMLLSGQHSGASSNAGSNSVFSNFSSGGSVYRKHPNILKSSSAAVTRNLSNNSGGGPQIISNIRLTPAITTTSPSMNPTFVSHQTQPSIFQQQQQLRSTPSTSTGIRSTSVKICQSPNGKVFLQPANMDATKMTKLSTGALQQRLLTTNPGVSGTNIVSGGGGATVSHQSGSPHRIAIQKVQIIPAPMSGATVSGGTLQHQQQQRLSTATITLGSGAASGGGKSNLNSSSLFMPLPAKVSGAITLTKGNLTNIVSPQSELVSKLSPNVIVLDSAKKMTPHHTKMSTSVENSNQMITEDTPVDIIVDSSPEMTTTTSTSGGGGHETSSITAVLASNLIDSAQQQQQQQKQHQMSPQKQATSTLVPIAVLSATDWEMELDQATAASAALQTVPMRSDSISSVSSIGDTTTPQQIHNQAHPEQLETAETIILDDSFEDVIIEEEEEENEATAEHSENEIKMPPHDDDNAAKLQVENGNKETTFANEQHQQQLVTSSKHDVGDDKKADANIGTDANVNFYASEKSNHEIQTSTTIETVKNRLSPINFEVTQEPVEVEQSLLSGSANDPLAASTSNAPPPESINVENTVTKSLADHSLTETRTTTKTTGSVTDAAHNEIMNS